VRRVGGSILIQNPKFTPIGEYDLWGVNLLQERINKNLYLALHKLILYPSYLILYLCLGLELLVQL
jgi:hypothetical protein